MRTCIDGQNSSLMNRRSRASAVRSLLSAALCLSLLLSPASAFARLLPADTIVGVPLGESGLEQSAPDVEAAAGLVLDAEGRVLWARNASDQRAMASITKIMTALLALEHADLDDIATVSENASSVGWAIGLQTGERVTVRQLLQFALVASSNDAAIALAEHVGGNTSTFVEMMNDRARELELEDTHYVNPHGLDAAGHHSSANDIARIARIAMRNDEFRRIVAMEEVELGALGDRAAETLESTDELLGVYDGVFGVKTGFTDDAGYSFVGMAERDGIALTTVILGLRKNAARFEETSQLLDWGFEYLTMRTIATTTETAATIPVTQNSTFEVPLGFAESAAIPIFDLDGEIERVVTTYPTVDLPVYQGQLLGEVRFHQGELTLVTLPLVAARDVSAAEETVGAVPVSDYIDVVVTARASSEAVSVPEFSSEVQVLREVVLYSEVKAPVAEGDRVGEIVYSQGGEVLLRVPAVAAADVEAPTVIERIGIWFTRTWNWITGQPRMATVQLAEG